VAGAVDDESMANAVVAPIVVKKIISFMLMIVIKIMRVYNINIRGNKRNSALRESILRPKSLS